MLNVLLPVPHFKQSRGTKETIRLSSETTPFSPQNPVFSLEFHHDSFNILCYNNHSGNATQKFDFSKKPLTYFLLCDILFNKLI